MSVGGGAVWLLNPAFNAGASGGLKLEPVKFCHWAAPRYGDVGQNALNTVLAVVAFIVAYKSLEAQIEINNMRHDIADGYAKLSEDHWNRFENAYAPLERAMVNEIMATPPVKPNYPEVRADYNSFANNAFGRTVQHLAGVAKKYALCMPKALLNDLTLANALTADDGVNFGYRYAEWDAIRDDDIRWNRRANLANLGRDLLSMSAKYAAYADNMLQGLGDAAGKAFSGAVGYLGYYFNRQATTYTNSYTTSTNLGGVLDFGMNRGVGDLGGGVTVGGIQSGQF